MTVQRLLSVIIVSIGVLGFARCGLGVTAPEGAFYRGNSLYEQGRYEAALEEYRAVLSQGLESGPLYYNMGNCYFKTGRTGMAILYYEKARRLMPRDSDLEANLRFALSKTHPVSYQATITWRIREASLFMTLDEWTAAVSVMFLIVLVLIVISRLWVRYRRRISIAAIGVSVLMIVAIGIVGLRISDIGAEAVVISESADVRFEPIESSTVHYRVYEGEKVRVREDRGAWKRVVRGDGKDGWLKGDQVGAI